MKYIFLLGGHDLEMLEIKNILKENKQVFIDKNLKWGAKLSDYSEEIHNYSNKILVGIELEIDMILPPHYINIDHHNLNSNKLSSLEQVANLLNISLNRYQKLVAINDKSHIKGLVDFGASEEEINNIRKKDRQCQGVTQEDEKLAIESIKNNLEFRNGVVVVFSLTNKFSPIVDRLWKYGPILIYTEDELNYYGYRAKELGEKYFKVYGKGKVYFGGIRDGFFGFAKGVLSKKERNNIIQEVIEYVGD